MIEIIKRNKPEEVRWTVSLNEGSLHKKKLMTEDYLLLKFNVAEPIPFERGDYAIYKGVKYEVVDLSYPTYNSSTGGYEYQLRLDAYYWKWKNKKFFYAGQGNKESSWSLVQKPEVHLELICKNLESLGYTYNGELFTYTVDEESVNAAPQLIAYNDVNIIDALSMIAEKWEAEWWVEDKFIRLGRCQDEKHVRFELGKNVQSMSRSESKDNFATRIYAFGSTRNLPINYRKGEAQGVVVDGIVQKRLMLPSDIPHAYIDADSDEETGLSDMDQEEAVEAVVVFDDVYPSRIGTMSSVEEIEEKEEVDNGNGTKREVTWYKYRFKDAGIKFSEEYVIPGQTLGIKFASGALNGWDFGVIFNPDEKDETEEEEEAQVWEIVTEQKLNVPNPSLRPNDGDRYVLYGYDTSFISEKLISEGEQEESILSQAEKLLKQRAFEYVKKSKEDPSVYDCRMSPVDMMAEGGEGDPMDLNVGNKVTLLNPAYFDEKGRQSRIYGFEKYLDGSQITYTVGNTSKYSRLAQIENEVKKIVYQGNTYSGSGGSGVYVIGNYDVAAPSDRNVFSALRSMKEFVSRLYDNVIRGTITFMKSIFFGDFEEGFKGAGIYQDEDGNWHIEGDYGHFRKKITAEEVEIQTTSHIGGKQMSTAAEMVCSRVEEFDSYWRCYFRAEDANGNAIDHNFEIHDLAYAETFNLVKQANGMTGNHFFWREVVAVSDRNNPVAGEHYIDLSKESCAKHSDAPMVGDNIVQLGNTTNKERQGAIIQASVGDGAPYYRIYDNISSYGELPDAKIDLNPKDSKITASSIILESKGKKQTFSFDDMVSDVEAIKKQNDNMWVLWFSEEEPTLENYPASEWLTDAEREEHLQDMVVIDNQEDTVKNGRAWRFHKSEENEFYWSEITDVHLIEALNIAKEGRDNAVEKRQNFVQEPGVDAEYEPGDTWSNATYPKEGESKLYDNDNLVAISNKAKGTAFNINHWRPVNNATSASLKVMENSINALVEGVHFDNDGKIINISTSGLVVESEFATLFSEQIDENDIVKRSELSAYVEADEFGDLLSVAQIEADKINFVGKTIINGNFVVDEFGDLYLNNLIATNATVTGLFETAKTGRRFVIDPSDYKLKMYDDLDRLVLDMDYRLDNGHYSINSPYVNIYSYLGDTNKVSYHNRISSYEAYFSSRNENGTIGSTLGVGISPYSPGPLHYQSSTGTQLTIHKSGSGGASGSSGINLYGTFLAEDGSKKTGYILVGTDNCVKFSTSRPY